MKIKTVVLALSMLLIAAGSVEAHTLTTATAKQKIRQQATKECKGNCTSVTVDRCRRHSRHRVSCHAAANFRNGNGCTWITTATANHKNSKVELLIRDLTCSKG
ncbi:MAG TPA: hypothetical protein VLI94_05715 [Solirubrobacterales bacterium]|nr:hypothetical protein [Solirubrobacterales bacterium]